MYTHRLQMSKSQPNTSTLLMYVPALKDADDVAVEDCVALEDDVIEEVTVLEIVDVAVGVCEGVMLAVNDAVAVVLGDGAYVDTKYV